MEEKKKAVGSAERIQILPSEEIPYSIFEQYFVSEAFGEELKNKNKENTVHENKKNVEFENFLNQNSTRQGNVSFLTNERILWLLFAGDNTKLSWNEFQNRCQRTTKSSALVYLKDGVRMLNVSRNTLRGPKKWFTTTLDENDSKQLFVMQDKFISNLTRFCPIIGTIIHPTSPMYRYGFALELIFSTLSLPSYAGPLSDYRTEIILKGKLDGEHLFRFSSSAPLNFALDYVTHDRIIKAIRLYRINETGIFQKKKQLN